MARWDVPQAREGAAARDSPNSSQANITTKERVSLDKDSSAVDHSYPPATTSVPSEPKMVRRVSLSDRRGEETDGGHGRRGQKESNTDRLRFILNEPAVRNLFREFLKTNFCEENLTFWLEVEDFKRKFNTTSSARGGGAGGGADLYRAPQVKGTPGQVAMERHHEALIQIAFVIYNTYLAPSSQCELNIDHGLRGELVGYLSQVMTEVTGKTFQGRVEPEQAAALNATQLQTMIRLYDRIQTHVFRLMATDSVPKVRDCLWIWLIGTSLICALAVH